MVGWLVGWLVGYWLAVPLTDMFFGRWFGCLVVQWVCHLFGRLVCLVIRAVGRSVGCSDVCSIGQSLDRLFGCSVDWLFSWVLRGRSGFGQSVDGLISHSDGQSVVCSVVLCLILSVIQLIHPSVACSVCLLFGRMVRSFSISVGRFLDQSVG